MTRETCVAASRLRSRSCTAAVDTGKGIAATAARAGWALPGMRTVAAARSLTGTGTIASAGALARARPVTAASRTLACTRTVTPGPLTRTRSIAAAGPIGTGAISAWPIPTGAIAAWAALIGAHDLLSVAAAEIEALVGVTARTIGKFLLHVLVAIFHAMTVCRIVLEMTHPRVVDIDRPVDVDVVVAPIDATAPVISA